MRALLFRLLADDDGQEILEYAVLAAVVVIGGYGAVVALQTALRNAYAGWATATERCADMPGPGAPARC
jgi:Flp pilus assembly pilin Flp